MEEVDNDLRVSKHNKCILYIHISYGMRIMYYAGNEIG